MTRALCDVGDLDATGAKDIVFTDEAGARISVFVVKHDDTILGYVNSCPHARLPLNFHDDQFFDVSRQYLLCANHSAYFDIKTGQCIMGPCKGKALTSYPVQVIEGKIIAV